VTQEGVLVMKILEAAKRAGLTVKTVRYYANIGMVTPHQNPATGYRDYSEEDVAKLQFVGKARRFDFSVEECRELLELYEDRNRPSREVKALTLKKVAEIDARLNELQSLKDELSGLASACDGDHRPNCPILEALGTPPI
jgi:Cu(I)-responsive transcriptional regulator